MDDQELHLKQAIALVAKEKGIEQEALEKAIEDGMLRAAEKIFKGRTLRAEFDRNDSGGVVKLYHIITITDDVIDPEAGISVADDGLAHSGNGQNNDVRRKAQIPKGYTM